MLDEGVLDALVDQIAIVQGDGVIVAVNRAWREFAAANGAPAEVERSVGLNYLSVCGGVADGLSDGDATAAAAGIRAVLSGAVERFELEYPCDAPGESRWFEMSVTPLAGYEGGPAVVVCHHNITQRRRAEDQLRSSEDRLAITLHSIGDGVIVTDAAGVITAINATAERLTGWLFADAAGRSLPDVFRIVDAESKVTMANPVDLVIERGEVVGLTNHAVLLARDGREYQIADSAAPMRDRHGTIVGVVLVFSDVSDEYRTRQQLASTAALLERTSKIARIGGWERDLVTGQRMWTSEIHRIFEIEPSVGIASRGADGTTDPAQDEPPTADALVQLDTAIDRAAAIGPTWDLELPLVTAKGRPIWVRAQGESVVVDGGVSVSLRGVLQDVTERKRLEADLLQAAKTESIGRLAGGVAHDFNNMLTVILTGAEMALDELPLTEPARAHLEQIRSAAQRSADLTGQLLTFARQQTVEPSVIDLDNTVTAMTSMLHRLVGEEIRLTWSPEPDVWPISIDPSQFDQILTNLVVNARDAIAGIAAAGGVAAAGMISISVANAVIDRSYCAAHWEARPGDHVRLSVTDNGVGIDEHTQRNVFEPFFTTKDQGTGLGLSTVYGIVEQNNGFITITSAPGHGAVFEVFFPRHHGPVDVDTEPPVLDPDNGGRETILVVEDETAILSMITSVLEADGYTVLAASNATEAIRLAREHPRLDLLLTDVIMPEMNGRDLAAILSTAGIDAPHLFMSGYPADVISDRGVLDKDLHFIQKPFTIDALLTKIRDTLVGEPQSAGTT